MANCDQPLMANSDQPLQGEALLKETCRRIRVARSLWDAHNNAGCRKERERALVLYNQLTPGYGIALKNTLATIKHPPVVLIDLPNAPSAHLIVIHKLFT
jgi:hypothetical protein